MKIADATSEALVVWRQSCHALTGAPVHVINRGCDMLWLRCGVL